MTKDTTFTSSKCLPFRLYGHDKQVTFLLNSLKVKQIPNAWLFHGPAGIGKASLALNIAKVISSTNFKKSGDLNHIGEDNIRYPRDSINVNNVVHCKRKWDDKKKQLQKYITIDEIRDINRRFSLTSTDNSYKVCIIDSSDDLNISASNSLLKMLEEPPSKTVFILISSNQQSVIPTILSRCQKLSFQKLSETNLREIGSAIFEKHHFDELEKGDLLIACQGSARKLLHLLDKDYGKFFSKMQQLFSELPNLNKRKLLTLISGNGEYLLNTDPDKSAFGVLLRVLALLAKGEINRDIKIKSEHQNINLIAAHLYSQISLLRHQAIEYNLDMKKVFFLAFNIIELAFEKYGKE